MAIETTLTDIRTLDVESSGPFAGGEKAGERSKMLKVRHIKQRLWFFIAKGSFGIQSKGSFSVGRTRVHPTRLQPRMVQKGPRGSVLVVGQTDCHMHRHLLRQNCHRLELKGQGREQERGARVGGRGTIGVGPQASGTGLNLPAETLRHFPEAVAK